MLFSRYLYSKVHEATQDFCISIWLDLNDIDFLIMILNIPS